MSKVPLKEDLILPTLDVVFSEDSGAQFRGGEGHQAEADHQCVFHRCGFLCWCGNVGDAGFASNVGGGTGRHWFLKERWAKITWRGIRGDYRFRNVEGMDRIRSLPRLPHIMLVSPVGRQGWRFDRLVSGGAYRGGWSGFFGWSAQFGPEAGSGWKKQQMGKPMNSARRRSLAGDGKRSLLVPLRTHNFVSYFPGNATSSARGPAGVQPPRLTADA